MQRNFMEKRRRRPSYVIPILFFSMEILMMWLVLSLFNWDIDIFQWNKYAYVVCVIWIMYSGIKLKIVLKRQKASHA